MTWTANRLLGAAALAWLSAACGPSVQSIYEGNVRFEHCYRLDLDVDIAPTHRRACWKTWLASYTYGQPLDRIEYGRRRDRAFTTGDDEPPTLDLNQKGGEPDRQFYLVVPAPTSLHASPQPIATRVNVAEPAPVPVASTTASVLPAAKVAPGESCSETCRTGFSSCASACEATPKGKGCAGCEPDYKSCMRRCFE